MKQRRTCIIRLQPGNGKGTKPANAAWTKPGTHLPPSTEGKESWRFHFLRGKLEGGVHRGCVGGAFSKEHRFQGLKSSITSTVSAAGSIIPPHDSHTDLSRMQIQCLLPSHGFPLSTRENPNSLACVQTHVVDPASITKLLSHNAFVLFHATPTLHSFRRLQALAHAVLNLAAHFFPLLHLANS